MDDAKQKTNAPKEPEPQADYKYIGDDGGRWLFERRSDGLCLTIDKPATLTSRTRETVVRLTVRGKKFRPEVLRAVRK